MKRIAFFDAKPYDRPFFERYRQNTELEFVYDEARLNLHTAGLADGFDGICAFVNDDLSAPVLARLAEGGVRVIALRSAGYNHVDLRAAKDFCVMRVPGYSPNAVAEHAMAMLLTSVRRIHKAYNRTRDFNFSLTGLVGQNLFEKTVGIVGMGKIGRVFADICRGFGMKILAYDAYPSAHEGVRFVPLDTLFAESDVISLHCPLTPETHHMICAESIGKMKTGVILVNTSRGALIDAEDLLDAIKQKKVGAACLDVYEEEAAVFFEDRSGHILNDDVLARLISMPNVLLTSHQAFLTEEALDAIAKTTVENLLSYFAGAPQNVVE